VLEAQGAVKHVLLRRDDTEDGVCLREVGVGEQLEARRRGGERGEDEQRTLEVGHGGGGSTAGAREEPRGARRSFARRSRARASASGRSAAAWGGRSVDSRQDRDGNGSGSGRVECPRTRTRNPPTQPEPDPNPITSENLTRPRTRRGPETRRVTRNL
jgi:hypothetical protein